MCAKMKLLQILVRAVSVLMCNFVIIQGINEFALLEARSAEKTESDSTISVCIAFNGKHQVLPSERTQAQFHRLVNFSYVEGCAANDFNTSQTVLENTVVAVARGSCTFVQKARVVQSLNGAAVLVVDYRNSTRPTYPYGNETDFRSLNITVAVITFEDYRSLFSRFKSVEVTLYDPENPLWDYNMVVMVVFSTMLVMVGAAWSAYDEWQLPKVTRRRTMKTLDSLDDEQEVDAQRNDPEITICNIIIWFCLICCIIMLLYFFYDYMVYFFITVFCLAGTYSLYHCLLPLWSLFLPAIYDIPVDMLPCINSKVKLRSFFLLLICATVGIFWAIQRHEIYAWIFQDLMGTAFCIYFIHTLHLPNLKVIAIFLILLLVYDVFFVFITPNFTSDGNSVMESVATGGRGRSKEKLPMVFLLPTLSDLPIRKCMGREFSLLGFGDVIIPGMLVAYNAAFDVKTGNKMVYFICSSLGYFIGMIICILCLIYMESGQPALLYLVPGTLFTTILVALVRKEFHMLFFGLHKLKPKPDDNIESQLREAEDGDVNNDCLDEEENLIK